MTATLLRPVDIEELTENYLRDQNEMVGVEIVSVLPGDKTFPLLQVHKYNHVQVSGPALWYVRYSLQIDVWGAPKKAVVDLAFDAEGLIKQMEGAYPEGVVTGTETFGGDANPDPDMPTEKGRPRPHARFLAYVWAHPAQFTGS